MKRNMILIGLLFFCCFLVGCDDPYEKEDFLAYDEQPIGLYLESKPEYTEWVKLMRQADLFNAVNINIKYTCFVANNEAVLSFLKSKGFNSVSEMTEEQAANIVKYHLIAGNDYAAVALQGKIGTTVSGDYLTVKEEVTEQADGTSLSVKYVNDSEIVVGDMHPINGYVHELKEVMDPLIFTVLETLERAGNYKIFVSALKACGLDTYLNRKEITIDEMKVRDFKTVMAVTDETFEKEGIKSLEDLEKRFGKPAGKESDFYQFMAYHILPKEYDYADLTTFVSGNTGLNVATYADKEFITVADIKGVVCINPETMDSLSGLRFSEGMYNIPAYNGYIHQVDGLMPVAYPIPYAFEWEPTEWDEFRVLEYYRKEREKNETDKEMYTYKEHTPHMRWKSIPADVAVVQYWSYNVDYHRFLYDDLIYANLGGTGWIEFDTPIIIKGRYNIKVVKWSWSTAGQFQMYIDGVKFGPVISMSGGGNGGGTADLGVFEFETSEAHVFKFSDVTTSGTPTFYLDRFIFTPQK